MNPSRFDTLTRRLGDATDHPAAGASATGPAFTRRRGLAMLLAGLFGLAGVARTDPAAAKQRCLRNGTRCNRKSGGAGDPCRRCCSGFSRRRLGGTGRRCAPSISPACGNGGPCTVFVTNAIYQGNLGGLEGADALCRAAANAAGSVAPAGTYRAWLSTLTASAADRFYQSPEPYVLVDGTQIAADWDDLTDPMTDLEHPINLSETEELVDEFVWTNTNNDGTSIVDSPSTACDGWTSASASGDELGAVGNSDRVGVAWTRLAIDFCNEEHHLYCFQQD